MSFHNEINDFKVTCKRTLCVCVCVCVCARARQHAFVSVCESLLSVAHENYFKRESRNKRKVMISIQYKFVTIVCFFICFKLY